MTSQTISQKSDSDTKYGNLRLLHKTGLFAAFLACGLLIFFLGSNYFVYFPTNKNLTYNLVVSAVLLVTTLGFRRHALLQRYWQIAFAFFVASLVLPITLLFTGFANTILGWLNLTSASSLGLAISKAWEMILVVIPVLVLTKLSGADLGSIYLKRGNLKLGLSISGLIWFNFVTSVFLFFALRYTSMGSLGAAIIGGLIFSLTNGFMEEVWLRGIFLKRFEPVLGVGGSVLLTSLVFGFFHAGATYLPTVGIPFMVANTITLGLACGYLMMKSDSIWGSVVIHAAADFFLFVAMLAPA
jgi:membrane protease YdiL (CAAX protease family)